MKKKFKNAYTLMEVTNDRGEESFRQDLNPEVRLQKFVKVIHECAKSFQSSLTL